MKSYFILLSLLVLAVGSLAIPNIDADDEKEQKTIGSRSPKIATQENNVYLIWEENTHGTFSFDLFFRKSSDYGKTFDELIDLTGGKSDLLFEFQIGTSENNVYIVWLDLDTKTQNREIYFRKSDDFGESFGNTMRLTPTNNTDYSYNKLKLQYSENNVSVLMEKFDIQASASIWVLRQSYDFGESFGKEEKIDAFTSNMDSSKDKIVTLAYGKNEINEYDLFFRNIGIGFTINDQIKINDISTNVTHIFGPWYAELLHDNNSDIIYVNWIEESHLDSGQAFHYLLRKSTDRGKTFGDIISPLGNTVNFVHHITAKMNKDDLLLLWPDFKKPPYNDIGLYLTKIIGDEVKTQEIPNLSQYNVLLPQFVISDNNIYIIGESSRQKHCIYFTASSDNGITFGNITNVNNSEKGVTCTGDNSEDKYELPPLKQLKSGIPIEDIRCRQDLIDQYYYVLRANDDSPACVKVKSYGELIKRGWIGQTIHGRDGAESSVRNN